MIYLSSTTSVPDKYLDCFGFMLHSNRDRKYSVMYSQVTEKERPWMLDNGAFHEKGFNTDKWLYLLLKYQPWIHLCLGVVIPDKVGDALETLRLFTFYHRVPKDLGYKIAFVTQDGITPIMIPWDLIDVLFIGGSDCHKLGQEAGATIAEARQRGKWIHIGRVNSPKRIEQFWHADSVDGTHINYEPDKASEQIARSIRVVRARKSNTPLFSID